MVKEKSESCLALFPGCTIVQLNINISILTRNLHGSAITDASPIIAKIKRFFNRTIDRREMEDYYINVNYK